MSTPVVYKVIGLTDQGLHLGLDSILLDLKGVHQEGIWVADQAAVLVGHQTRLERLAGTISFEE